MSEYNLDERGALERMQDDLKKVIAKPKPFPCPFLAWLQEDMRVISAGRRQQYVAGELYCIGLDDICCVRGKVTYKPKEGSPPLTPPDAKDHERGLLLCLHCAFNDSDFVVRLQDFLSKGDPNAIYKGKLLTS
jgi:hypothetical protein